MQKIAKKRGRDFPEGQIPPSQNLKKTTICLELKKKVTKQKTAFIDSITFFLSMALFFFHFIFFKLTSPVTNKHLTGYNWI